MNEQDMAKLATSVEVLATRMTFLESTMAEIRADVRSLTEKPAKKWETFIWECTKLILAAVIGFACAKIGV